MTEPIDLAERRAEADARAEPSNAVYARVGDLVLQDALRGVRTGTQPDEIIRTIIARHGVRLTLGELRLLLATRRRAPIDRNASASAGGPSPVLTVVAPEKSGGPS
jgi:hypothetical protein